MTDKELLELAAKAAGLSYAQVEDIWNPLTDDGDALRLAVKLDMAVMPYPLFEAPKHSVVVSQRNLEHSRFEVAENYDSDPYAATRRAIVRAAAEIGKNI